MVLFLLGIYFFYVMSRNLQNDVKSLTQEITSSLKDQNQLLNETQRHLGDRLDGAARVVGEVQNRLGRMEQASQQIFDLGKDIRQLENILRAPKLRGVWSELFLDELIAQVVPKENYILQYAFKNGVKVDAVLTLQEGLVPIDAKFPLENFKRILESQDDDERRQLKTAFANNVKKHIDDIHDKYILPKEGTFDFALMYIPAENVYYEIMSGRDEVIGAKGLAEYARSKKVIAVSPSTFFSYLQTILLGLKGMRIEQSAREVLEHLTRLKIDFSKFTDDFRVLGNHLKNVRSTYDRCEKLMGRVDEGLSIADQGEKALQLEKTKGKVSDEELV
ncbi:MAG: DNA recombination protein RmuC [Candidatus Omnitrophica bacterium]|nr:DNA recombination protein RmuC [Candidatus Omnitrophota bacterium]